MSTLLLQSINIIVSVLLAIVCILVAIAYFTLAERKLMASVQRRVGPNVVGPVGLLQPLADGVKLAGKELAVPTQALEPIFLAAAKNVLWMSFTSWLALPFGMFDYSEQMSSSTVVNSLTLTEVPTHATVPATALSSPTKTAAI